MLEEQVAVTAVEGSIAWVEPVATAGCGSCSQVCSSAVLQKYLGRRREPLAVSCSMAVRPGDRVVIGIDERALLGGSLLVYVLPLCGLLAGAAIAETLTARLGVLAEWPTLLGGVLGFAVSVTAVRQFPGLGVSALRPVVLRKIPF